MSKRSKSKFKKFFLFIKYIMNDKCGSKIRELFRQLEVEVQRMTP